MLIFEFLYVILFKVYNIARCERDGEVRKNARFSKSEYMDVFSEAKEKNVAIEINTSPYLNKTDEVILNDPLWEIMHIAKECGCKFTFGSDCHHPDAQKNILASEIIIKHLGITEKDILVL